MADVTWRSPCFLSWKGCRALHPLTKHCQQGLKERAPLCRACVISSDAVLRLNSTQPVLSGALKAVMVFTCWRHHSSVLQLHAINGESWFWPCLFCNVTWVVENKILHQIALNGARNRTNVCIVDLTRVPSCYINVITIPEGDIILPLVPGKHSFCCLQGRGSKYFKKIKGGDLSFFKMQ